MTPNTALTTNTTQIISSSSSLSSYPSAINSSNCSSHSSASSSLPHSIEKNHFPRVGDDVTLLMLSYLRYEELHRGFLLTSKTAYHLRDHNNFIKFERKIFSEIKIFDQKQWKNWKVEITDEYNADKIDSSALRNFLISY